MVWPASDTARPATPPAARVRKSADRNQMRTGSVMSFPAITRVTTQGNANDSLARRGRHVGTGVWRRAVPVRTGYVIPGTPSVARPLRLSDRGRRRRVGSAAAPCYRCSVCSEFVARPGRSPSHGIASSAHTVRPLAVCTHSFTTPERGGTFPCNPDKEESPIVNLDPKAIIGLALDPKGLIGGAAKLAERAGDEAYFAALCVRSGLVGPEPPHRLPQLLLGFQRYGLLGGAAVAGGLRHGDRPVMIDERGELSYKALDERSNALANAWREKGLQAGEGVAILARNHRGFLEGVFGAAKCGARIVLLNTSF